MCPVFTVFLLCTHSLNFSGVLVIRVGRGNAGTQLSFQLCGLSCGRPASTGAHGGRAVRYGFTALATAVGTLNPRAKAQGPPPSALLRATVFARPPVRLLWLDPRQPLRAGSGVRAALEGVAIMEAGARELALPAVTELLRVDHLE